MITHPPAPLPRYNLPRWQSRLQVLSRHLLTRGGHSHGRMMCNDNTPPPPASLPRLNPLAAKYRISNVFLPPLHPRGDHAPRYQVTCDSLSNPTHHACLLVSALPPHCVPRSTAILPSRVLAPLPARTKCVLRGTVAPAPSCRGHQHVVQVAERASSGLCSDWRGRRWWCSATHATTAIHSVHLSYRVCSLCSSVPRRSHRILDG
jgi:hypothetical protein